MILWTVTHFARHKNVNLGLQACHGNIELKIPLVKCGASLCHVFLEQLLCYFPWAVGTAHRIYRCPNIPASEISHTHTLPLLHVRAWQKFPIYGPYCAFVLRKKTTRDTEQDVSFIMHEIVIMCVGRSPQMKPVSYCSAKHLVTQENDKTRNPSKLLQSNHRVFKRLLQLY